MRTRPKDRGTAFETDTVRRFQDVGLIANRIAEGGSLDEGDICVPDVLDGLYIEAKVREQLQIHHTFTRQIAKTPQGGTPIVVWKRMAKTPGGRRRQSKGTVAILAPDDLAAILAQARQHAHLKSQRLRAASIHDRLHHTAREAAPCGCNGIPVWRYNHPDRYDLDVIDLDDFVDACLKAVL